MLEEFQTKHHCYCFWLKWAGYLAVASLNLPAEICGSISPDKCVKPNARRLAHLASDSAQFNTLSGFILSDIRARRFRAATARYPVHFSQKITMANHRYLKIF